MTLNLPYLNRLRNISLVKVFLTRSVSAPRPTRRLWWNWSVGLRTTLLLLILQAHVLWLMHKTFLCRIVLNTPRHPGLGISSAGSFMPTPNINVSAPLPTSVSPMPFHTSSFYDNLNILSDPNGSNDSSSCSSSYLYDSSAESYDESLYDGSADGS